MAFEDPIAKYLPKFADHDHQPKIHHLLTHTSGLSNGWFGPESQDTAYRWARVELLVPSPDTLEEWVKRLGPLHLAFRPGEQCAYSMSAEVLGRKKTRI